MACMKACTGLLRPTTRTFQAAPRQIVQARTYAVESADAKKKKKKGGPTDSRDDTMRDLMYNRETWNVLKSDTSRLRALHKYIPSAEVHETIHRAWLLHKREKREGRTQHMRERYNALRSALKVLESSDTRLFKLATKTEKYPVIKGTGDLQKDYELSKDGRLPGLFPRQFRPPVQAGKIQWNSDWIRPEEENS